MDSDSDLDDAVEVLASSNTETTERNNNEESERIDEDESLRDEEMEVVDVEVTLEENTDIPSMDEEEPGEVLSMPKRKRKDPAPVWQCATIVKDGARCNF